MKRTHTKDRLLARSHRVWCHGNRQQYHQCHCSLCRRQGGSASNSGIVVPSSQLQWIRGWKEHIKSWIKESGFRSDFCSVCGSPVPNPLRNLEYYWIPVGVLEDGPFNLRHSICTDSKASWGVLAPAGKQFETMPELDEFIALLSKMTGKQPPGPYPDLRAATQSLVSFADFLVDRCSSGPNTDHADISRMKIEHYFGSYSRGPGRA